MSETQFESDQFLKLLTDALRAGPGSPQWHQAVQTLQATGRSDERALLMAAREHLESGKSYRSIRPGPEFTRKVLSQIEAEAVDAEATWLSPAMIAGFCGALILLALLVLGYWLLWRVPVQPPEVQELALTHLGTPAMSVNPGQPLSSRWRTIGSLPLDSAKGLRPLPTTRPSDYIGGGIVSTTPIEPDEPFAVSVRWVWAKYSEDVILQVFVTDRPEFSADRATSEHEFVWMAQGRQIRIALPGGQVESRANPASTNREELELKLTLNRQIAIVDLAGRRLWAGQHQLSQDRPRYVGVRFLDRSGKRTDAIVVQSVQVLKK